MTIIAAIDDHNGMLFNHRRQSRDRALTARVTELARGHTLRMSPYSAPLFPEEESIAVSDDFLSLAGEDDFCFVETADLLPYADRITHLILCRWNRDYPADTFFPLAVEDWQKLRTEEFPGSSHECITLEEYVP